MGFLKKGKVFNVKMDRLEKEKIFRISMEGMFYSISDLKHAFRKIEKEVSAKDSFNLYDNEDFGRNDSEVLLDIEYDHGGVW